MPGDEPWGKVAVLAAGMGGTGTAEGVSLPLDVPSSCSWSQQREGAPSTGLPHARKSMECQDSAPVSLLCSPWVSLGLQQTQPREGWQREGATPSPQEPRLRFQKIK